MPRPLQRDPHRPHAREAHRQDHRRILGADHRGRRQLQHVQLPAKRKARRCWWSPSAPGSCYMMHQVVQKYQRLKGPRRRRRAASALAARTSALKIDCSMPQEGGASSSSPKPFSSASTTASSTRWAASRHHLADQYELQRLGHPYLQLARRRRRRPPGSRQEYLLLEQGPGPHGARAEALRLHAFHAIGWRAVGRDVSTTRT